MAMDMERREKDDPSSSSSLLLLTTMWMVGLPVEVQVKDGSLYSGVFYTASIDSGNYGVILKKARKIGKGRLESSFTIGSLIDILVIFSDDLVQIAVKNIVHKVEKSIGNLADDGIEATTRIVESEACILESDRNSKSLTSGNISPLGQVGKDMPEGEENSINHIDEASEANNNSQDQYHSLSSGDACPTQVDSADGIHGAVTSNSRVTSSSPATMSDMCLNSTRFPSSDAQTSSTTSSSTSVSSKATSPCPSLPESPNMLVSKKNSSSVTGAKEFKLNPGAKDFSPSPANFRSAPAALPTITSPGFISNFSVLPIASAEPGLEITSFTSHAAVPTKLVQYNGFVNGHTGVAAQYPRHVVGHAGSQQQPIRFTGHHHSLQAGPAYIHPTSPPVMTGRTSQLVYVHPIAPDTILGASVFPHGSPYPLMNPCQANMPKFQGSAMQPLQLYMAPPQQAVGPIPSIAVPPNHVPLSHPFAAGRPVLLPGGNCYYGSKFS